jgi:GSH-dependent disulfide-bond oxidoreductase
MTTEIELHRACTGNCLRAAVTFEEAGLPYTPVRLDLRHGAHGALDYLSLNPAGKVPTVVDRRGVGEPFILTQSNAIMLWVAEQRPGLLLSVDDPAQRATTLERYFYFITDVIERSRAAFQLRKSGEHAGSACLDRVALEAAVFSEIFLKDSEFMAGASLSPTLPAGLSSPSSNRASTGRAARAFAIGWTPLRRGRPCGAACTPSMRRTRTQMMTDDDFCTGKRRADPLFHHGEDRPAPTSSNAPEGTMRR